MLKRRRILQTISQPDAVEFIRNLIYDNPQMNRTEIAASVCDQFGFVDLRDRKQMSSCLKALRNIEAKGLCMLPPPQRKPGCSTPRRLDDTVPAAQGVPNTVGQIRNLELYLVETEEQIRIWNELMIREHPRGAGPLVGRQLRYLIGSDHGWLGGLGFAASAWQLRDRDRWIGWDNDTRQTHLDRIIGLSRFLIRNDVHCRNLASRVLGLVIQRLPHDFEARYKFRPWLVETFIDTTCHDGACFQAANWIRVGASQGTGRFDSKYYGQESVKDIYLYPLVQDFREQMKLPAYSGLGPLPVAAGLEAEGWAQREFGGAPIGDKRLTRRLVEVASLQAEHPGHAFSSVAKGDQAMIKGFYRFIEQPDDSAVTMENILLPHREQTMRRMKDQKTVLCIQDGSDLNYNSLAKCEGLGVIGKNQTQTQSRGLHLHTTLAVTDEGLPLGVLRTQCWAPIPRPEEDKRRANAIPIEEKRSYCWIQGLRDCQTVAAEMPHTQIITVMDREADFFELFDEWHQDPSVDLLVRAMYDRDTTEDRKLFESVKATEPQLRFEIHVARQSARLKQSKQKAKPKRTERVAEVALRYKNIKLLPPSYHGDKQPVPLTIIQVVEEHPPEGVTPLEWFLLSTTEITSPEQALKCLEWYCLRWRIEDWHRVLKSGCEVEDAAYETTERLKRGIAINAVIAWRIMLMTLLGRETPDLPADILFSDIELKVLVAFAESRNLKPPERLQDAVNLVAKLGGYMGRKNDPPPGHQLIWGGYTTLRMMCRGAELFMGGP